MVVPTPNYGWHIDAGSGTTLPDDYGTVDGSIIDATWLADGSAPGGYVIDFDGTGDRVEFGTTNLPIQQAFSFYAMVNVHDPATFNYVFGKGQSFGTGAEFAEWYCATNDGGTLEFGLFTDELGRDVVQEPYTDNTWLRVAGRVDMSDYGMELWVDGSSAGSNADPVGNTASSGSGYQATFGYDDVRSGFELDGQIAESAYWDTSLTTSEIQELTTNGLPTGPFLDVTITNTNSPVGVGESLQVTADIENTGSETDTQTITLDVQEDI